MYCIYCIAFRSNRNYHLFQVSPKAWVLFVSTSASKLSVPSSICTTLSQRGHRSPSLSSSPTTQATTPRLSRHWQLTFPLSEGFLAPSTTRPTASGTYPCRPYPGRVPTWNTGCGRIYILTREGKLAGIWVESNVQLLQFLNRVLWFCFFWNNLLLVPSHFSF